MPQAEKVIKTKFEAPRGWIAGVEGGARDVESSTIRWLTLCAA